MQAATLPASYGWLWVRNGLFLFKKQPLAVFTWALAISLLVIVATVTPPIGPLLFVALMPVVTLMTLSACRHIYANQTLLPSMWVQPLKEPGILKKLLAMGALYAGVSITAGLVAFLPFSAELTEGINTAAAEKDLTPFLMAMRVPVILFGTLYVIIAALFWHAPVLVAWHGLKLTQALFFSGVACWRNKWPFLIYGLAWLSIFMFIDLCTTLLMSIGLSPELAGTLQIPFNIAAGGVLYCSFYPVYTSIFGVDMSSET
jgi:hypothetical protein